MLSAQDKARINWQCRRGMLELDLILQQFLAQKLDALSTEEVVSFQKLLSCTDPELFAWFMGHEQPQDLEFKTIVDIIRSND